MNVAPPNPTRNALLLLLALLALVALSGKPGFGLGEHFRQPEDSVRENRFLALGRMAEQLGVEVQMQANFTGLPPLVENGSTLWLTVPGRMLSTDDIAALQRWVGEGGRLVERRRERRAHHRPRGGGRGRLPLARGLRRVHAVRRSPWGAARPRSRPPRRRRAARSDATRPRA